MKKLSILCACTLVLGLMSSAVFAQTYCIDADQDGNPVETELTTAPGGNFCIDVYLCGMLGINPTAGGAWLDHSGAPGLIGNCALTKATPPWDPAAGVTVCDALPDKDMIVVGNLGGAAIDSNNNIMVGTACYDCVTGGDAVINVSTIPATASWGPNPPYDDPIVGSAVLTIHQVCVCTTDSACDDGLWCSGEGETCVDCACVGGSPPPCFDGDPCTLDDCDESTQTCDNSCDEAGLSGPTDSCLGSEPCASQYSFYINMLIKENGYYQPPAEEGQMVTIKNKVCLYNPEVLVGGIQFDLCDSPDCLTCINCELTERTVMFDCVVTEFPNGCCRVIMFCRNPGCAINPGLCDIVTVVQQTKDPYPEECLNCIEEGFENIIASDYNGFPLATASIPGTLCPVVCGDVCPAGSGSPDAQDCGDGVIDIYDIMCEVNLALLADLAATPGSPAALGMANDCQQPRADVPTGTPGFDELLGEEVGCADPDGYVTILDVMVLIDAALNRQDCCSFYYTGTIY